MIRNVSTVSVPVRDPDRAIDFYVNKLGFVLQRDDPMGGGPRWVQVGPRGAQTSLVLTAGYADAEARVGTFSGIVFETDDIKGTYDEYSRRGVVFTETPTVYPYGIQAQFKDQDENTFVLIQRQRTTTALA